MRNLRHRIPPLSSLIAFEAAARLCNFTRAAQELGVTQAAVSRQMKELEDFLQQPLFERGYRSISLTQSGRLLSGNIGTHLTGIADLCEAARRHPDASSVLVVGMTSAFGSYWLTPRLAEFRLLHPEIELQLAVNDELVDLRQQNIDLSIRYGEGCWPRLLSEFLVGAEDVPVCSAAYWKGRSERPAQPADLLDEALISMEGAPAFAGSRWSDWFYGHHVVATSHKFRITVNNFGMLIQATLRGQGIALAGSPLIDDLLASGQLVPALQTRPRRISGGYFLVYPEGKLRKESCEIFRRWLVDTVAREAIKSRMERLLTPGPPRATPSL